MGEMASEQKKRKKKDADGGNKEKYAVNMFLFVLFVVVFCLVH